MTFAQSFSLYNGTKNEWYMWNVEIADDKKQAELLESLRHVKIIDVKKNDVIGYNVSVQTSNGFTLNWRTAGISQGVVNLEWYHNYGVVYNFTEFIPAFRVRFGIINDIAIKEFEQGNSLSVDEYTELINNSKTVGVSTYRPFILKGYEMPKPQKRSWGYIGWYIIAVIIVILIVIALWIK